MKYLILLFTVFLSISSQAQHCPFDGASLIAAKLVNAKGTLLDVSKYEIYLLEVNNPKADSCTYASGILKVKFLSKKDFFTECDLRYRTTYSNALQKRLKEKGVTDNSNLFVSINQAETSCMIKNGGNFIYQTRVFVISISDGKKELQFPVPENAVRSLCTNNKLDDFEPIVVKLQ